MEERRPVPPEHIQVQWADYTIVIHPAVQSRVDVADDGRTLLPAYRQLDVHHLLGRAVPLQYHLGVRGGPQARDLEIIVTDATGSIHAIEVELKPTGQDQPPETVRFQAGARTCPPYCA